MSPLYEALRRLVRLTRVTDSPYVILSPAESEGGLACSTLNCGCGQTVARLGFDYAGERAEHYSLRRESDP